MKPFLLFFLLLILIPENSYTQKLQEPNYPNCSELRGKNENYASADGEYVTWCNMKKQTAYVRCQCRREKMMASYKKQIEDLNTKIEKINEQASSFRKKYDDAYKEAQKHKAGLYEDDNSNFENDRQNTLRFLKVALQNKQQQLKYLEESDRLNNRKPGEIFSTSYTGQSIKYAKDAINNISNEIEEVNNKKKKQKISLSFNNTSTTSKNNTNNTRSNSSTNTSNQNQNNSNNSNNNSRTYQSKYQNSSRGNNTTSNNNKKQETYQQKQNRLRIEKKNKEIEEHNRKVRLQQQQIANNIRFHAKMEAYSKNAMSKFDQAAQGDLMAAGIMKGTYAIAMASQGYTDKTAIVGAATNIIGGLMANAEKRRAEEARQAAIAAEKRKREAARRKFIAKLVRNRKITLARMQTYKYPNFLTNESANSVYFFAMLADEEKLKEDLPEIKITDLIEIARYSDGTWPSENTFKEKLTKYGSYDVKIIGAFTNYSSASRKLEQLIKGFAENGVKIKLVNAAKDFIVEKRKNSTSSNSSDKNNLWGTSISERGNETKKPITKTKTSQTKKETKIATENSFWGKSITLEKKKAPILAVKKKVEKKKKKDLWSKTIKVEKKKDSTTKKKKIKKGF